MKITIEPGVLQGAVTPPPSKSHVHRLLIAAALCSGETAILCPGDNADIQATIRCLQALGVSVQRDARMIRISGPLQKTEKTELDCGESGSTLRFMLPLCAAQEKDWPILLTGHGRLPSRPNGPLLEQLREHGAQMEGDFLPIRVHGGLKSGDYALPGNISSQYFTGLLMALPLLAGESRLRYTSPLESMPYVDLTLSVLRQFGIRIEEITDGWRIPGNQRYISPGFVEAEGDWSAAAFWLSANHLGSEIQVLGMNPASPQGDKAIERLLNQIGGEVDVTDTPDLMPVLSAVAAARPGETVISGAARLRIKESDRLSAMAKAINALGGAAEEKEDGLIIRGGKILGGVVDGMNDHRVVMSAAIAATVCQAPVTILGAEAADKSYPGFFEDFVRLGGKIHVG